MWLTWGNDLLSITLFSSGSLRNLPENEDLQIVRGKPGGYVLATPLEQLGPLHLKIRLIAGQMEKDSKQNERRELQVQGAK